MINAETFSQYTAPRWMKRARCADADPALFFPEPGEDNTMKTDAAKRICRHCPVKARCLQWAFETGDRWAVLGETTPNQRTRLRERFRHGAQGDRAARVRSLSPG